MLNDPPPEQRPVHPLERKPLEPGAEPPPADQRHAHPLEQRPMPRSQPLEQQVRLHIPAVSPSVTYVLVALNVAIYAVGFLLPVFGNDLLDWGANIPRSVLVYGEYHRLFTAMFLHGSVVHILFNALVLYQFGSSVERIFGHARFVLIYVLGGLAGSVMSAVLGSGSNVPSIGASGAIFAVIGAEYIFFYQHRKLMGERGRAHRRSLLMFGLINLLIGALSGLGTGAVRIDNWGHLGGLIGGLALTWYIGPFFVLKRHPEQVDHFVAVDVNPLGKKYVAISLYCSVLLAVLVGAVVLMR